MSTAVYLANKKIQVVVGGGNPKRVDVKAVYETMAPEGCIINGVVTDEEMFLGHLREFWEHNKLPMKDVTLVINSSQMLNKQIEMPVLNEKKTLEYIPIEFVDVERTENPVFSYATLSTNSKAKKQVVFTTMTSRDFMDTYLRLFKELKIDVKGIISGITAAVKLLTNQPFMKGRTGIVQILDEMNLTSIIFVEGQYYYSSSSRIFSDHGTADFAREIARTLSNSLQFVRSQQVQFDSMDVFTAGLDLEDFKNCSEVIEATVEGAVSKDLMDEAMDITVQMPGNTYIYQYLYAIGGLLLDSKYGTLLKYYKNTSNKTKEAQDTKKLFIPAIVAGSVCLVATAVLGGTYLFRNSQYKTAHEFNTRPDVVASVAEYDDLQKQILFLQSQQKGLENLKTAIASYPKMNSTAWDVIEGVASGVAEVKLSNFTAATGVVNFNATASDMATINVFVQNLRQKDLFYDVNYTGYTYNEGESSYSINVVCTLAPNTKE